MPILIFLNTKSYMFPPWEKIQTHRMKESFREEWVTVVWSSSEKLVETVFWTADLKYPRGFSWISLNSHSFWEQHCLLIAWHKTIYLRLKERNALSQHWTDIIWAIVLYLYMNIYWFSPRKNACLDNSLLIQISNTYLSAKIVCEHHYCFYLLKKCALLRRWLILILKNLTLFWQEYLEYWWKTSPFECLKAEIYEQKKIYYPVFTIENSLQ